MKETLRSEAIKYFRNHSVMLALLQAFSAKYRSLGHFGGTITLTDLKDVEQRDLGNFLRRKIGPCEPVSFREVKAAWEKTRFEPIELEEILLALLPADFASKKEEKRQWQEKWRSTYEWLLANHSSEQAVSWLHGLNTGSLRLPQKALYLQRELLDEVAGGLDYLPEDYERLPIFANKVTGNPHALDFDQSAGRLLLQALAYLAGIAVPTAADTRTNLLYQYRIIRDDILNFATVYGLAAYCKNGEEILYWRQAASAYAPLNLPLREIVRAERIVPVLSENKAVYIVENSGVFSALLDKLLDNKTVIPLIALHGQLKAASWALLDRLTQSGAKLFYCGDLDPEGIAIAQHILERYDEAELWHMSVKEYKEAVIDLPEDRIKKLPASVHSKLEALVQEMRRTHRVLYQESFIDELVNDLM